MFSSNTNAEDELDLLHIFPSKEIKAEDFDSTVGKSTITQEDLNATPAGNGDMNEVLRTLPSVILTSRSQSSKQAGEIKPGKISINGSKSYENNFMIDGVSNNSLLNPEQKRSTKVSDAEGHPQEIFLDSDILRSVVVYTSNVPAEYGQFIGGVIDAKTKRADFNFSGKISTRYTSDQFTSFHVDDEEEFEFSEDTYTTQPKFEKININLLVNAKISDSTAFYINLARKKSTIPLLYFGETTNEYRQNETNYIKLTHYLNDENIIDISYMSSPYHSTVYLPSVKNSQLSVKGGGEKLIIKSENTLKLGQLNSTLSFGNSQNSRHAPDNLFYWKTTKNKPWGLYLGSDNANEGGYGDIEKEQQTILLKSSLEGKTFTQFNAKHLLKTGVEFQNIHAYKKRPKEHNVYSVFNDNHALTNLQCRGANACVEGDQFSSYARTYKASINKASINNFFYYLQDSILFKQLFLRLGLRYDYNDFLKNHDISLRSFAKFDITNEKKYYAFAGINRYYSNNLLSQKLAQAGQDYYTQYRSSSNVIIDGQKIIVPDDWTLSSRSIGHKNIQKNIKTPYKDEYSFGFETKLSIGKLYFEYLHREGNDEFTRYHSPVQDDGLRYYSLINDGFSKYTSLTFSWEKNWLKHRLKLNFRKPLESTSNHTDYNDNVTTHLSTTEIFYKEKVHDFEDFSKINSTPDTFKLSYHYSPSDRMNLGVYLDYKPKQEVFVTDSDITVRTKKEGETNYSYQTLPVYYYQTQEEAFIFDLRASYAHKIPTGTIKVTLDINNLLDKTVPIKDGINEYMVGRQFWFGISYAWE